MAWRILQFSTLFAIGCSLESNSDSAFGDKAFDTPNIELSLKLIDPQDVIVRKDQSARFQCRTETRKGQVQFTWYHNEEKIPEDDSTRVVRDNGELYIPKVISSRSSEFVGEYKCLAKNRAGALLSNVAKLKVASMEKAFMMNPMNSTVHFSQPAILRCSIHSIPLVDIQWEHNNDLILPHQTSYVPLPNGVLLIQKSQSFHSGTYRCKATNDLLNKTKYSNIAYMTVLPELTEATVPSFLPLNNSPNVTVLFGEKLTLYCAVMGWPIPTVQWLNKDNIVIGNTSVLEVPDVQISNGGSYECLAYNNMGRISQNFNVVVKQKPSFTVTPVSKSYPAAITARLDCRATGIPEPSIKWLKDGQPLKFDSRVRKQANGIIFSHTFTNDSGMYQCVAANSVGRVWTAVQIDIINVSQTPSPPQKLRCRPYNSSTICLSWKPPINVSVTGYSVHSFYNQNGVESVGPDYARNVTEMDAGGLSSNTEYTFYVRLYSTGASDPSEKVTCRTGVAGNRNLDIEQQNDNSSVILKWSEISTDISCTGEKFPYKIQWKSLVTSVMYTRDTKKRYFNITGLSPGKEYIFRVTSTNKDDRESDNWTHYTIPDLSMNSTGTETESNATIDVMPLPPSEIKTVVQSPSVVKLKWTNLDKNTKFFMVCYKPFEEKTECDDRKLLKSFSNKLSVKKLKPNTRYEFRVRAHNFDGVAGIFSEPVYATTQVDVPSPIMNLQYKVINESTIYLQWQKPKDITDVHKINKYIISYTSDRNLKIEKWPNVTVNAKKQNDRQKEINSNSSEDKISTILGHLDKETHYTILVRAVSDVGIGKPTVQLDVTTNLKTAAPEVSTTDVKYNQKVGFIIGTIIALLCIICCIVCILLRRRCVKRRALIRSRMSASNNYYPAVAHYASEVGAVQVRLEEACDTDEQEIQFLVPDGMTTNIPPVQANHLDTKGRAEFPNGHTNGSAKPFMNGHIHITENPQFYAFNSNGQVINKKPDKFTPLRFEEDSNSNVKPSKFYDLHRLFENSKKLKSNQHHRCNPHFGQNEDARSSCDEVHSSESSKDVSVNETSLNGTSLNATQMTTLNDTLNTTDQSRRKSPILGPNG